MCENVDLNACHDVQQIAEVWIDYVCELLKNKTCPHYFVNDMDLFALYENDGSIDRALHILINEVRLNELIKVNILDEQQTIICKLNQNKRNFLSQLKARDVLNALNDYRTLQSNWLNNQANEIPLTDEVRIGVNFVVFS